VCATKLKSKFSFAHEDKTQEEVTNTRVKLDLFRSRGAAKLFLASHHRPTRGQFSNHFQEEPIVLTMSQPAKIQPLE